jgi:hypothetical protein
VDKYFPTFRVVIPLLLSKQRQTPSHDGIKICVAQLITDVSTSYGTRRSLPFSQQPATSLCPEPYQSSPHFPISFFCNINFNIILLSKTAEAVDYSVFHTDYMLSHTIYRTEIRLSATQHISVNHNPSTNRLQGINIHVAYVAILSSLYGPSLLACFIPTFNIEPTHFSNLQDSLDGRPAHRKASTYTGNTYTNAPSGIRNHDSNV